MLCLQRKKRARPRLPLPLTMITRLAVIVILGLCLDNVHCLGDHAPAKVLTVQEGQDTALACEAKTRLRQTDHQYPDQFDVHWIRRPRHGDASEAQPISGANSTRYQILSIGSDFHISPIVLDKDDGIYTCVVTPSSVSSERFSPASSSVDLNILRRTHINVPPKDTKIVLGFTAELPCGVNHDKSVSVDVAWSFNERPIRTSSRTQVMSDGTLRIEQARNTDVGVYTCKVTSSGGSDHRSARLDVIELPHAPTNVRAELNVAGGLVNVSWSPPFDGNSPIVKYVVEKRVSSTGSESVDDLSYNDPTGSGWTPFAANISSSQNFTLLTNLRPARTYQFRVVAMNAVGKGQPSLASHPPITLPAQAPSAPPQGVVGAARSSTSVIIQWQPPPNEAHNGLLKGFLIRYKLAGYSETPWYYRNVTNPSQLSYLLDDLIVWRNYEIEVAAFNEMGTGAYSPSIQIRTREGQPASAPSHVGTTAINSTALRVWWSSPDPQLINGILQGYKIKAFSTGRGKGIKTLTKEVIVNPVISFGAKKTQEAVLHDLEPYTQYLITVLCFTSAGDGPPNEPPVKVETLQDLPEKVAYFKFSEVLDTSIRVEWAPPAHINGELLGYTLNYSVVGFDNWKAANYSPETNATTVGGLSPETSYIFEMYATTRVGAGPSVRSSIKSSVSPVEVGDLFFSEITMTSLKVSWSPPSLMNGTQTLVGYHVIYEALIGDFSKQVKQRIKDTSLTVSGLKERVNYVFRVRAETLRGVGPEKVRNVTTGPQPGSPESPLNVTLTQQLTSVRLRWNNARQMNHLLGYLIEGKQVFGVDDSNGLTSADQENEWQPVALLKNGIQSEYDLSFTHLSPSSKYALRIFAMNSHGISEPAYPTAPPAPRRPGSPPEPQDKRSRSIIITPSHLELRARLPFYRESWFVIMTACMTIVVTIMVIAVLCVQSKAYKYKKEAQTKARSVSGSRDALSDAGFGLEDNTYASGFELRQNAVAGIRRSSVALNSTAGPSHAKPPPRPAPGSISYSDEEEDHYGETDAKESNIYGSSGDSLTEKPSEMSSSGPDSESDHDEQGASNHFMNHYANVNDTLRKGQPAWKRHGHPYTVRPLDPRMPSRPAPPVPGRDGANAPPSYLSAVAVTASEDSELESPNVNLNGGRIIVNNQAGSRAPLPGFSSFV